jgi:hypothetical protein
MTSYILMLCAPLIGILYSIGEHFKLWDRISGRDKAIEGINRLRSGAGYPVCFIYNDSQDSEIFDALYKRIIKNTTKDNIKGAIRSGHKASLIATIGQPIPITGLPEIWPQEERFFYSENHPVLIAFDVVRNPSKELGNRTNGKGDKACTIKELDDWIRKEESNRKFYIGTLMVGILSISLIVLRSLIQST